jgi:gamma-glutamyltranspeptidase/glutathione hydrolase
MSVPHFINEKLSFTSRRSAVLGVRCAVSTPQPLATQVGADLLKRGANAVDAAVGIAAALAVTEPCSTGLGGDCFMLLYTKEGGVVGLNASGKCPSRLTLDIARDGVGRDDYIPHSHPYSITVPGAAAGWCDAVERWGSGKLSMAEILEPAALIAEQGFPVSTVTAEAWGKLATTQLQGSGASELMIDENRGPRAGEVFKNPSMARVLRELGKHGKKGFYSGWVADAIVEEVQREGGLMTHDDLSSHCSSFPDPISVEFEGYRLWEVPPNGQGITALMALQVLKASAIDFRRAAARTPERLHAQIEALRIAFADTRHYCADPDSVKVPIEELLSDKYAQERVTLLNPDMANTDTSRGCPESTSCTVSFQVVDSQGMAVSFVKSVPYCTPCFSVLSSLSSLSFCISSSQLKLSWIWEWIMSQEPGI